MNINMCDRQISITLASAKRFTIIQTDKRERTVITYHTLQLATLGKK